MTVDMLRNIRSAKFEKGSATADDLYSAAEHKLITVVKSALNEVKPVLSNEMQSFLSAQRKVRQLAGCGPASKDALKKHGGLIKERNQAAKSAKQKLHSPALSSADKEKILKVVKDVVIAIRDTYKTKVTDNDSAAQLRFYPRVLIKEGDGSIEQVLDGFLSMYTCVKVFESKNKNQWVSEGADSLYALFNQLAILLTHRFSKGDKALSSMVQDADKALGIIEKAQQANDKVVSAIGGVGKSLYDTFESFYTAKINLDIARIKAGTDAAVDFKAHKKEYDELEKRCIKLFEAQKKYFGTLANGWNIVNGFLPEFYHVLQPMLLKQADMILQTICVGEDYYRVISLFNSTRSLQDYENFEYLQSDLIRCTYKDENTILLRFNLANQFEAKALFKELVMQQKCEGHVVERASLVFIDNSTVYIHVPNGENTFEKVLKDEQYTGTATTVVLYVRQMIRAVHDLHNSGVIHGDITPRAWLVTEAGLAKLHAFRHARIPSQVPRNVKQEPVWHTKELKKYESPERGTTPTFESDVYGLGMCVAEMCDASKGALQNAGLLGMVKELATKMTHKSPGSRITTKAAFQLTNDLFGKLKGIVFPVKKQKEELKHLEDELKKSRKQLEKAADSAEEDLTKVAKVADAVRKQETALIAKQKRLHEDRDVLMRRQKVDDHLKPPPYWVKKSLDQMVNIHPIQSNGSLFQVFRHILKTDDKSYLNQGRDVVERGNYTFLDLIGVWRVENSMLWQNYATERANIMSIQRERNIRFPRVHLRPHLANAINHLPGAEKLHREINEEYLLHGTKGEVVLSICTYGINERFTSVALFGKGSYFAEDPAKNDQYCIGDQKLGSIPDLHRRLFPTGGNYNFPAYPLKAYYLLLCRVILGFPVRVQCVNSQRREMENLTSPRQPVFATDDQRELTGIEGVNNPPILHHSLLAEKGGTIVRFREFVQFHSERIYPEYLICYTRK